MGAIGDRHGSPSEKQGEQTLEPEAAADRPKAGTHLEDAQCSLALTGLEGHEEAQLVAS